MSLSPRFDLLTYSFSVPLVLVRKPPAWLWLPKTEITSSQAWWDGDVDELEPELGPAELRPLFEWSMEKRVGSKYVEDAFGKGRRILTKGLEVLVGRVSGFGGF